MDCCNCENNYLYKIFKRCMNDCDKASEALYRFDKICIKSEDPRNALTIINRMYDGDCEECKQFKHYYDKFIE